MAQRPPGKNKTRAPLSRERVLGVALALADEIGLESLSMRRLGQEMDVQAMSLYKHVANKDAILDGIVDMVAGEIELPEVGGDWRQAMFRRAMSAHRVLMAHPWATLLIVSRANVGPAMLRYVDATIGCLHQAGFPYALADHAWNAIDAHIYGFTLHQLNFPFQPEEYAEVAKAYLPSIPVEQYPHLHGLSVEIIEGRHDGIQRFEFALNLILDGLETLLSAVDQPPSGSS
ncbi:MAG: TetR/AcrR family transcriptional regulator C-terminal domain-containing protein [Planctomycetes bacterium]|nr:TetR/AcrR family transcriptional regulator C-terminal domain-containing protein [Planctomycetota bacterium]